MHTIDRAQRTMIANVLHDAMCELTPKFDDPCGSVHMATAVFFGSGCVSESTPEFEQTMQFLGELDLQPRNAFAYEDQEEKFMALCLAHAVASEGL